MPHLATSTDPEVVQRLTELAGRAEVAKREHETALNNLSEALGSLTPEERRVVLEWGDARRAKAEVAA